MIIFNIHHNNYYLNTDLKREVTYYLNETTISNISIAYDTRKINNLRDFQRNESL